MTVTLEELEERVEMEVQVLVLRFKQALLEELVEVREALVLRELLLLLVLCMAQEWEQPLLRVRLVLQVELVEMVVLMAME